MGNITGDYLLHMEDVLNQYHLPYDAQHPLICFDERVHKGRIVTGGAAFAYLHIAKPGVGFKGQEHPTRPARFMGHSRPPRHSR